MKILDTDVLIDLLRSFPPAIRWLDSVADEVLMLPGFVVMELIQGCHNRKEQNRVMKILEGFEVLWPTEATCERALKVFGEYHLRHGMGMIDVIVGQMSVDFKAALHTFNRKHYEPIPGISLIQPYKKG